MSRQARVVAEGVPHHITQWGALIVFLFDEQRRFLEAGAIDRPGKPKSTERYSGSVGSCLVQDDRDRALLGRDCIVARGLAQHVAATITRFSA